MLKLFLKLEVEKIIQQKKLLKTVEKFCETLLDASYKHKEVRSSTYVSEMTNKLIYVVEKNFQSI